MIEAVIVVDMLGHQTQDFHLIKPLLASAHRRVKQRVLYELAYLLVVYYDNLLDTRPFPSPSTQATFLLLSTGASPLPSTSPRGSHGDVCGVLVG